MAELQLRPDRDEFLQLARRYPVVPVSVEVLGDRDTPVSAFEELVGDRPGFLLESVEGGEVWGRWSFAGSDPAFTLTSKGGVSRIEPGTAPDPPDVPPGDPLTVLETLIDRYRVPDLPDLPPLHSGAVGYLAYDTVRYLEHLPDAPPDDRGLPEMLWQFVGAVAAFDRLRQTVTLIENVYVGDDPAAQFDAAAAVLAGRVAALGTVRDRPRRPRSAFAGRPAATANVDQPTFEAMVRTAIDYVHAGDAFQIVPSLRLETSFTGDPFAAYRALRLINPSPFLFFIRHPEVTVVGSSPEVMARARGGIAYSRPIAGTRPRGASAEEDQRLEEELLADPKERAEHVMLVDLSRNDLGRVCEYGTVTVDELMVVERYSHVMHIVSGVSGKLRPDTSAVAVLRATFPHGTVSGAPKVRAMEIIDELEPTARGPYAGAVGYLDFSGNLDTCIGLRTMVVADGKAWVQAGAGIVADSDPASEYAECLDKAAAVLAAIAGAGDV